ncbi:MAG: SOS response-associated peptidase [Candidatus Thiodiazotropha sp. (ex Lucinoma kastoroae)]|nr:SOS response-associated peptidase [Candidatus Thiodiazotropha sp. (ex Lucinoma kastoroae)]
MEPWLDPKAQDPVRLQALISEVTPPAMPPHPVTRRHCAHRVSDVFSGIGRDPGKIPMSALIIGILGEVIAKRNNNQVYTDKFANSRVNH